MQWYFTHGTQQEGPITTQQIKALAHSGHIQPTDKIRREGDRTWTLAANVKGLSFGSPPGEFETSDDDGDAVPPRKHGIGITIGCGLAALLAAAAIVALMANLGTEMEPSDVSDTLRQRTPTRQEPKSPSVPAAPIIGKPAAPAAPAAPARLFDPTPSNVEKLLDSLFEGKDALWNSPDVVVDMFGGDRRRSPNQPKRDLSPRELSKIESLIEIMSSTNAAVDMLKRMARIDADWIVATCMAAKAESPSTIASIIEEFGQPGNIESDSEIYRGPSVIIGQAKQIKGRRYWFGPVMLGVKDGRLLTVRLDGPQWRKRTRLQPVRNRPVAKSPALLKIEPLPQRPDVPRAIHHLYKAERAKWTKAVAALPAGLRKRIRPSVLESNPKHHAKRPGGKGNPPPPEGAIKLVVACRWMGGDRSDKGRDAIPRIEKALYENCTRLLAEAGLQAVTAPEARADKTVNIQLTFRRKKGNLAGYPLDCALTGNIACTTPEARVAQNFSGFSEGHTHAYGIWEIQKHGGITGSQKAILGSPDRALEDSDFHPAFAKVLRTAFSVDTAVTALLGEIWNKETQPIGYARTTSYFDQLIHPYNSRQMTSLSPELAGVVELGEPAIAVLSEKLKSPHDEKYYACVTLALKELGAKPAQPLIHDTFQPIIDVLAGPARKDEQVRKALKRLETRAFWEEAALDGEPRQLKAFQLFALSRVADQNILARAALTAPGDKRLFQAVLNRLQDESLLTRVAVEGSKRMATDSVVARVQSPALLCRLVKKCPNAYTATLALKKLHDQQYIAEIARDTGAFRDRLVIVGQLSRYSDSARKALDILTRSTPLHLRNVAKQRLPDPNGL